MTENDPDLETETENVTKIEKENQIAIERGVVIEKDPNHDPKVEVLKDLGMDLSCQAVKKSKNQNNQSKSMNHNFLNIKLDQKVTIMSHEILMTETCSSNRPFQLLLKVIHAKKNTDSRIRCLPKKKLENWPK